ncbi:hypothetical protein SPI_03132 [Niveomyces insectorum RCEF 264]|uniref:Glucan 4-alpha-glucosidase n=1 Tax=Niveomyces insectorum RCEF 264 TaxID=1081102 RepID=A0A167X3H0_9HYPO|nr:hypothetical protein SPI_03132 [Niveomyces insectorum RCEF 264]
MPPQESTDDDGASSEVSSEASSEASSKDTTLPPRVSTAKRKPGVAPTTPKTRKVSSAQTPPRSAPAATTAPAATANRQRRASQSQKPQPTLLTDFFLGRPSQARINAQRRKSLDAAAVKAEMRMAVRQSSIQRIQRPGGVKERVKAWQKNNAAAMAKGNPEVSPSEPTDVAFREDEQSVTEADRLRIRARQRSKANKQRTTSAGHPKSKSEDSGTPTKPIPKTKNATVETENAGEKGGCAPGQDNSGSDDNNDIKYHALKVPKGTTKGLKEDAKIAPKKRIVSDDNWLKRRNRTSPKPRSPKATPGAGNPIPKDFLQRTAQNPPVSKKIKEWAKKVEPPTPTLQTHLDGGKKATSVNAAAAEDEKRNLDKKPGATSWRSAPDDGIRVRPLPSTRSADEKPAKQQSSAKSASQHKTPFYDDGIRVRPIHSVTSKEPVSESEAPASRKNASTGRSTGGLRPSMDAKPRSGAGFRNGQKHTVEDDSSIWTSSQAHSKSNSQTTYTVRSAPAPTTKPGDPYSDPKKSAKEYRLPFLDTPTKKPKPKRASKERSPSPKRSPSPTETQTENLTTRTGSGYDESRRPSSWSGEEDDEGSVSESYGPSSVPPKSLADIPVGYSAFSELDLPLRGEAGRMRSRASKKEAFKGVPQVLKKVVSEGKKMIHDKVDPPRPVANQPPNIENWLDSTVNPFIDTKPARKVSSTQKKHVVEEQWKESVRRRSVSETRRRNDEPSPTRLPRQNRRASSQGNSLATSDAKEYEKPTKASPIASPVAPAKGLATSDASSDVPETPTPKEKATGGLKRSGAKRSTSSPLKQGSGKKPFRDVLRDAFRGESGVSTPPMSYSSYEVNRGRGQVRQFEDQDIENTHHETRGSGQRSLSFSSNSDTPTVTTLTASFDPSRITETSDVSSSFVSSATSSSSTPRRRPPPTSGDHELSTIVSVESFSTRLSESMSTISESTVTQDTAVTKATKDNVQQQTQEVPPTALKRRLTKHSDLVSVLSLPEDALLPERAKSIKLARSLHRKTSKLDNATLDDLLLEFAEDESLYRRELRTLTAGVIPVLLTQFVENNSPQRAASIFGTSVATHNVNTMSRAVVNMGIILEQLNTLHQFVPLNDAPRMVDWLEKAYPVYNNYLDVWRLGFQGIIVNLAPTAGKTEEDDSLVNGMNRNEDGDVLDENGERVDVAYLLRRPLGVNFILGRGVAGDVVGKLDALHEKARRRNREETARKIDEDASATDTTRARDLRNLTVSDNVRIDQTRQVSAKDGFDLYLSHSNGQRLECQVELVFRDNLKDPSDRGDVLIRETGGAGRSWLLFPPISMPQISARRGQNSCSLVAMVCGRHNGQDWYELIDLVADNEETATDWLGILGTVPVPPLASTPSHQYLQKSTEVDVPVGERKTDEMQGMERAEDESRNTKTPHRYHKHSGSPRATTIPSTPRSKETVPTVLLPLDEEFQSQQQPARGDSRSSHPLREDMRPNPTELKPSSNRTAFREDGAPPPPVHQILVSRSTPVLPPSVEPSLSTPRVRRRTSSPLKHEYHPSDISSESDSTSRDSESESDPSSDELDEDEVPDTLPGISIKKPDYAAEESVVSKSSLAPSNSASQGGLYASRTPSPTEDTFQLMASISYWSNRKGAWKDFGEPLSTIVVTPGLIEAFVPEAVLNQVRRSPGPFDVELETGGPRPLIALDLTPLVMIRQSTIVDLEIRSPIRTYSKYNYLDASIFRFRAQSPAGLADLYMAVHQARLNNVKFRALEEEARFRSFGQPLANNNDNGDDNSSRRRRGWFGRKNSYRASTRAPSQSQGTSSSISANSFLKRLTGGGNTPFNINGSTVDRQSRAGSGGGASYYTSSGSSSAGGGGLAFSAPRSPSISLAESSNRGVQALGTSNIKTRCHLQVSSTKWEDHGNCMLTIARPPPGVRQELTIYHGLEKRVLVVSIPKKANQAPLVVVDVVVGSACFSRLAARGIVLNVWEEMRDENNRVGTAPSTGASAGRVRKWCFQFSSAAVASWVFGLVASEVEIA